ncbi:DUF6166 domain-containing protein [Streptomyces sp. SID3343]|uniref:DUF6166 domain-containing protein n=1 Tax=Streptomyces sp. SID3343 TaxID=2690260 RepID=UPI001368E391|nr:DUF6166 domain-containing protein [Streptomyces sp. SID3343]MYW00211.1 hypothetical protein [Streptomyces sp. SID3343]
MVDQQDRVYHGIQTGPESRHLPGPRILAHVLVEEAMTGPTERVGVKVLRELRGTETSGYGWGYNGTGTSNAAAAILADVLGLDAYAIRTADWEYDPIARLREAFCSDFLSTACDQWRLRHGAILRWARGWYLQHGVTDLPQALVKLPEVPVS